MPTTNESEWNIKYINSSRKHFKYKLSATKLLVTYYNTFHKKLCNRLLLSSILKTKVNLKQSVIVFRTEMLGYSCNPTATSTKQGKTTVK